MNLINLKFCFLFLVCYRNVATFDIDEYLENSMMARLIDTQSSFVGAARKFLLKTSHI